MFRLSRALLLLSLAGALLDGCAPQVSRFRAESTALLERVSGDNVAELFPVEYKNLLQTYHEAEVLAAGGETRTADQYYSLVIGKARLLENAFVEEVKRREDSARQEAELKRQALLELELQQQKEKEKAVEEARAAAIARKAEAERIEARRRAEKLKYEKEQPLPTRHTVKRGETLPQIAAQPEIYGDPSLWPLIYRANRDQISAPGVLWPGQQLKIPRNLDRNDINEARRFSQERGGR